MNVSSRQILQLCPLPFNYRCILISPQNTCKTFVICLTFKKIIKILFNTGYLMSLYRSTRKNSLLILRTYFCFSICVKSCLLQVAKEITNKTKQHKTCVRDSFCGPSLESCLFYLLSYVRWRKLLRDKLLV